MVPYHWHAKIVYICSWQIYFDLSYVGLRKVRATRGIYKNKMGVPERQAVDEAVDREIASYAKLLEKNQDLRIRVERALSQGR